MFKNNKINQNSNSHDYTWYESILNKFFNETRAFEILNDFKLPKDDDGVVLIFEKKSIAYFKTLTDDVNDNGMNSILNNCSFLEKHFNCPVDAYILFANDVEMEKNYRKTNSKPHLTKLKNLKEKLKPCKLPI